MNAQAGRSCPLKILGDARQCPAVRRVLVHAASGGVGLASLQLAAALGAMVAATAGSPGKRALLRNQHRRIAACSRDTSFTDDLLMVRSLLPCACIPCCAIVAQDMKHVNHAHPTMITLVNRCLADLRTVCVFGPDGMDTNIMRAQAGGMDVVLNSLTSPGMVAASLAALRLGGRFVEIGKRGIWGPAAVAAARPDVSYQIAAVDFLEPVAVGRMMVQTMAAVAGGRLGLMPLVDYGLPQAQIAMRIMSQVSNRRKSIAVALAS